MAAHQDDKFVAVGQPGSATSLSSPGYTVGDATITVVSTTNWPTSTGCVFAIDVIGADGLRVDGSYNVYQGTVATATSITNVSHISGTGTNRNYPAGTTTRVYIVVASEIQNRLVDGLIVEHDQDGTHKNITTDTIVTSGNVTIGGTLTIGGSGSGGYDPITGTITAVTANGNRSYDLTTSADNTGLISPGMRARSTRTVAAPTQCTSLNGTTQYYSCPSATVTADMTFTDDFVAGAWIKVSSYSATDTGIISRWNGTSGWILVLRSSGKISLQGYNGGAVNTSYVDTYQSVPLNKWVFVAAQLDMSGYPTVGGTNSYIMFDGVEVPTVATRAGTNPTALVQAGDLNIGSYNNGAVGSFFPGKIAQAFVSSAKITQANIKTLYSQGLTASLISTHSIISAYSFDNSITDLNTTSANNLTANGSAVATNADSPFGGQADGTISSTLDHGIIQKVTASTITVQVAEGCTIPTSGGVSSLSYATVKSPYGFPSQEGKWTICTRLRTNNATTSNATYGNFISGGWAIYVPVGAWTVGYDIASYSLSITTTTFNLSPTSLVGVAEGTTENIQYSHRNGGASTNLAYYSGVRRIQELVTTAKTYVMYSVGATTSAGVGGAVAHSELIAINAYL